MTSGNIQMSSPVSQERTREPSPLANLQQGTESLNRNCPFVVQVSQMQLKVATAFRPGLCTLGVRFEMCILGYK